MLYQKQRGQINYLFAYTETNQEEGAHERKKQLHLESNFMYKYDYKIVLWQDHIGHGYIPFQSVK